MVIQHAFLPLHDPTRVRARELAYGLLTAFVICETIALDEVMRMRRGKRLFVAVTSRGHDPSFIEEVETSKKGVCGVIKRSRFIYDLREVAICRACGDIMCCILRLFVCGFIFMRMMASSSCYRWQIMTISMIFLQSKTINT